MESLEAPVTNPPRSGILSVCAEEGITVGVKTCDRSVDRIERIVIAALAVFRLVVDRGTVDLYLTGGKLRWKFVMSSMAFQRQNST